MRMAQQAPKPRRQRGSIRPRGNSFEVRVYVGKHPETGKDLYGFSLCLFRGQPEPGSIAERVARIMPLWWTRCSASTSYFIGHKFGGSQRLPDFEVDQWCGLLPPSLQQIFGLADMKPTPRREDPPAPKPLAVIKPGPIADVMGQLAEAQQAHPDAEVRRGKRGTWELWPS